MSESDDGAGNREVAYRLFAAEFDDADHSYSAGEEERAPNYVVTPSGARVNRLFVVGVLTEVEQVSDDVLRARVVDPTGAFVLYAGQYQPDEQAFLDRAEPPTFVAVTGKARTFQPEDGDQVYTSVRPETINEVDSETRDRWAVRTAEQTIERVGRAASAATLDVRGDDLEQALREEGYDEGLAAGIPLAFDHYGTTGTYLAALRDLALDVARVVAGDIEEVEPLSVSPDAGDDGPLADLATAELASADLDSEREAAARESTASAAESEPSEPESTTGSTADATSSTEPGRTADTDETPVAGESGEVTENADATGSGDVAETADFGEAGEASGTDDADEADDVGEFEPGEFELDEEEREEIESEYGTDFQSGTEVEEPGEADIETPSPEEVEPPESGSGRGTADAADVSEPSSEPSEPAAPEGTEPTGPTAEETPTGEEPEPTTESESASLESEPATEPDADEGSAEEADAGSSEAADVGDEPDDLMGAVVDVMTELDEGNGADREAVVERLVERYGVDESEVEDAIQDALMDGRCYEPDDGTLKPI